jgi:hypothetical protein
LVEIVVDILWLTAPDTGFLDYLTAILYLFVSLSLAIFFIATAVRILVVLRRLRNNPAASISLENPNGTSQSGRNRVFGTAIKVGISGLSLLVLVACAVVFSAREFAFQMPTWTIIWLVLHTSLNVKGLSTLLAFSSSSELASHKMSSRNAGATNESRTSYLSSSGSLSLSRHSLA